MYDLAIRNARICDGTGKPIFAGEIAISDGRIAEIGEQVGPANTNVDAKQQVIAPGIIDNHTHYDAQITWDPGADPSPALGVTTVLIGNCGFTIAPCREADRDLTMRNLVKVEGMSLEAMQAGIRWDFETFYLYEVGPGDAAERARRWFANLAQPQRVDPPLKHDASARDHLVAIGQQRGRAPAKPRGHDDVEAGGQRRAPPDPCWRTAW